MAWLEGTLNLIPTACHGQGHLELEQVAPIPIQAISALPGIPPVLCLPCFSMGFVHSSDSMCIQGRRTRHVQADQISPCSVCCPAQRDQGGHPWQLPVPQAAWEPPCSAPGPAQGRRLRKRGKSSFLIPASDLRESLKAREAAGGCCCRSCPRGSSRQGAGDSTDPALARLCCSLPLASSFPGGAELAGLPWALFVGLHPLNSPLSQSQHWLGTSSTLGFLCANPHPCLSPVPSILLLLNLGITSSFGSRKNGLNSSSTEGCDPQGRREQS